MGIILRKCLKKKSQLHVVPERPWPLEKGERKMYPWVEALLIFINFQTRLPFAWLFEHNRLSTGVIQDVLGCPLGRVKRCDQD